MPLDKNEIVQHLARLERRHRRRTFWRGGEGIREFEDLTAQEHQYRLHPPLPLLVVEAFEAKHRTTLPADYRYFITEIGNGGAGPYYGLFKFGEQERDIGGVGKWEEGIVVGDLSAEFPHREAWNLPKSFFDQLPDFPDHDISPEEEDRIMAERDKLLQEHYENPRIMNGAIPICHMGCALYQWLVINGPQKGFIWEDRRVDEAGIRPLLDASGNQVTFADWYMTWLTTRGMANFGGYEPARTWRQRLRDWLILLLLISLGLLLFAVYLLVRLALGLPLPGERR
jgi:hypothetical protein